MLRKRVPQQGGVHRENSRDCPRGAGTGEHDAILKLFHLRIFSKKKM